VIDNGLVPVRRLPNSCILGGGDVEKLLGTRSDSSSGRLRRRRQNSTANPTATTNTRPPTTPPAIAPELDFVWDTGVGVGDGRVTGVDADGGVSAIDLEEEVAEADADKLDWERDRLARIGLKILAVFVTSRNAHDGITTSGGIVCRNRPTSTCEQFVAHSVHGINVRFWHPAHALMREYVTVLHRQRVASDKDGPT